MHLNDSRSAHVLLVSLNRAVDAMVAAGSLPKTKADLTLATDGRAAFRNQDSAGVISI